MKRLFKYLFPTLAVILVIMLAAFIFRQQILSALATKIIQERLLGPAQKYDDGLYAGLAGTGAPFPDIHRVGPCIVVAAGGKLYVVDAGPGSTRNIGLMGFNLARVEAILLTHFHSDHIAELGEVMLQRWATGSHTTPVDVIGPQGLESVVDGFNRAYRLDAGYRVAFHGPAAVPREGAGGVARPFQLGPADDASVVVIDADGLKVTAFKVNHAPIPAVGYRFDYRGRSLAISGDTLPCSSLVKHSRSVDVLFHEAQQAAMIKLIHDQARLSPSPSLPKITEDIPRYHTTPEQAAKIAQETGARHLALYHILPPLPPLLKGMFLGDAARYYSGPITVAEDGLLFSLPANSRDITVKQVLK